MVGEEDDVAAGEVLEDVVTLDVHVVQDGEVGDGEADAEAGEQPAPEPAVEERLGGLLLGEDAPQEPDARDRSAEPARLISAASLSLRHVLILSRWRARRPRDYFSSVSTARSYFQYCVTLACIS